MTVKFCKCGILLSFLYLNVVSVYLLPGVEMEIVLYIKDHNGNKFYFKLYCVILDELSVCTTFFCQIKRKQERKKEREVLNISSPL